MDLNTYNQFSEILDAASTMDDDNETLNKIKATIVAEHGLDDDVDSLFKYHT